MSDLATITSSETKTTTEKSKPIRSQTSEMQIGNSIYIIKTFFNENAKETAEDKFLRVVNNRIANALNNPQTRQNSG